VNAIQHPRPVRKAGVALRRSAGEIMLYDPEDEEVHFINATAAAIWELCDGETERSEMVDAICQLTGTPFDIIDEDVTRLLDELDDAGLILWTDAAAVSGERG
jgi:hypothetical protein